MYTLQRITQRLGSKSLFSKQKCCLFHSSTSKHNEASSYRPEIAQADSLLDIGTGRIWSEEHDIFRNSARRFFTEEVAPNREKWEKAGQVDMEIWTRAAELGFLGVATPAEVGGIGADYLTAAILWEEQWRSNFSAPAFALHNDLVIPYIVDLGTREQVEEYVPRMVAGTCIGAIGMTEPQAGSDLQGMRTYARRDGDDWILNGSKVFISHGHIAGVVIVVALTKLDAKSPAHGMSLFLLDSDTPGFTRGKRLKKLGIMAEDTSELFFDDVRLPSNKLLGRENQGFYHMMKHLPQERFIIASRAQGHSEFIFESTRDYVKQRKAFGKRIADFQTVQHKLAELKTRICFSRAFHNQCLLVHNEKGLDNQQSAMLKYITTANDDYVADQCLQLHGGYGYMSDCPVAKAFLDARIQSIWGGTNEIMKNIIAKSIAS